MEEKVYQPSKKYIENSRITNEEYLQMYQESLQNPESLAPRELNHYSLEQGEAHHRSK